MHWAHGLSHATQFTTVLTGEDSIVYPEEHVKQFACDVQVSHPYGQATQVESLK